MVDVKLAVFHAVKQHVHAGEVVGGDVFFLTKDFADGATGIFHALAHVEDQRAGAAGHVEHTVEAFFDPGFRFLTVEGDDGGEDVGYLLRGVEFARLLAGSGGELADEVFVGIAEGIDIGGKFIQPLGDLLDDGAELRVAVGIGAAQFIGAEIDFGKQAVEGAP